MFSVKSEEVLIGDLFSPLTQLYQPGKSTILRKINQSVILLLNWLRALLLVMGDFLT